MQITLKEPVKNDFEISKHTDYIKTAKGALARGRLFRP